MATIKDVAKVAGVSHGTVSNVLRGHKGVSLKKVKKVEEAIKALGYQPDVTARSLKTSKTMSVGVVLPNISDPHFSNIYTGIDRILNENGYSSRLFLTNEIAVNEKKYIQQIQQQRMDGIIIATCQPEKTNSLEQLHSNGTKVVLIDREIEGQSFNYVGSDNKKSVQEVMTRFIQDSIENIAIITGPETYSSEKECIEGYIETLNRFNLPVNKNLIQDVDFNKQSAFKASFRLLQLGEVPEVIITTSLLFAESIHKALAICESNIIRRPFLVVLSEESWTNVDDQTTVKIFRPSMLMGENAAEILLKNIESPVFYEEVHKVYNNFISEAEDLTKTPAHSLKQGWKAVTQSLNVLMLENSASIATYSLLADFRKKTGINVTIDILPYQEVYSEIKSEVLKEKYDVFQVDIPWLPEFAENGFLEDLSGYIDKNPKAIENLIPGILEVYAKHEGKFYGLPYMYGTQLLYYRKDLFEDTRLNRLFYEEYRTELKPPSTWVEFNAIAKFFTQKFNPDSPTLYGTSLGGKFYSGAVCEFLPRQWAYGGGTFDDDGKIILNSKLNVKALENYCESYLYASPNSTEHWWDEQVLEFSQGLSAMMILFMSHATDITDRYKSKVVGKIGFDVIPGGSPLLGGWSLGINQKSRKKDEAFNFISWACCKELGIPYTVLGGSTPCVNLYKSAELISIYPWLTKSFESFKISKRRTIPKNKSGIIMSEYDYERIIGEAVYDSITHKVSPNIAIEKASNALTRLITME